MKSRRFIQLGICLLLSASAGWLHAQPSLNGLAVSTEFGKERFIAALYTENLTKNAEEVLNSSGERRMELRVTADSLSARSINSMWVEGMAINNPASALEEEAENLARLSNLVRRRLRAGDILTFTASPSNGTTITINGVRLGVIRSDAFFPMLLRTWIGNIPLSSEFKDALLAGGDIDADLSARYSVIEPSDARVQAVATWVTPEPPQPQVADSTGIQPPKPDVTIAPPPVSTPAVVAVPTPEPADEQPQVAASSSAPKPVASEPKPAAAEASAPKPETPAPKPATQVAKAPVSPDPVEEDEDVEEVMVTAESLLLRQRYVSDVMRQTMQNMRYPRRAQERGQQGSIRLAVTVGRNGDLQSVQVLEESRHSLLTKEAVASVERASPFPKVPDGIAGETFAFGIPVTFVLQ